jgi:hypothetical protein
MTDTNADDLGTQGDSLMGAVFEVHRELCGGLNEAIDINSKAELADFTRGIR